MKKILLTLLFFPALSYAQVNPAPCTGLDCNVEVQGSGEGHPVTPAPPLIDPPGLTGGEFIPPVFSFAPQSLPPVSPEAYLPGEVWPQPDDVIQVRAGNFYNYDGPNLPVFGLQRYKEFNFHAELGRFQWSTRALSCESSLEMCIAEQENGEPPCVDAGAFRGARDGSLWKPLGDPGASCRGRAVILLPSSFAASVTAQGEILDSQFRVVESKVWNRGPSNGNRPTFCTRSQGSSYIPGPIYFRYSVTTNGKTHKECKRVQNPSNREE